MENHTVVPQKIKYRTTPKPSNASPKYVGEGTQTDTQIAIFREAYSE